MGQCYSVNLKIKLKPDSEKRAADALRTHMFTSGIYNEVNGGLARHCYQNQFFTADDGGLSCKNLFNKKENIYYLY